MSDFTDLFIDIEALGHKPGCAVIQIGAAVFDRHTGEIADSIQIYIQPEKNDRFHADLDTLAWHARQGTFPHPPDIAEIAFNTGDAVDCFSEFLGGVSDFGHVIDDVWSWGADYDFPIIEPLFERFAIGGEPPWMYWQVSDARTVWKLAFPGVKHGKRPHHALDDCKAGIADLCAALAALRGKEGTTP